VNAPGRIVVDRVSRTFRVYEKSQRTLKDVFVSRGRSGVREVEALRDVSLTVEPGDAVGLVGRNGSGKTTLLRLISGIIKPTSGNLETGGRVASLLELVRVRVGGEQAPVRSDRLTRLAVEGDLPLAEQHGAVAQALDRLRVVRDEENRAAAILELRDLPEALALELLVADREHLVQQEDVGLDVRRDREAEAN
jgi:ABC-type branched-subunit amino acid transport system ATPase component